MPDPRNNAPQNAPQAVNPPAQAVLAGQRAVAAGIPVNAAGVPIPNPAAVPLVPLGPIGIAVGIQGAQNPLERFVNIITRPVRELVGGAMRNQGQQREAVPIQPPPAVPQQPNRNQAPTP